MPTRLQLARNDIFESFQRDHERIYNQRDLELILSDNRAAWRLAQSMSFREFREYLIRAGRLHRLEFPFPHRKEVRYTWGKVPFESVLLTLKPGCHFSHFTAAQLHDLTEQDPRTIYVNHEQPPKPAPAMGLAQERIESAFRRNPRATRNVAVVKGPNRRRIRVCLLNGKYTDYLGVEERETSLRGEVQKLTLRVTDIERTLIDIAVRPFYAGGVGEVLKAYRNAAERVSVNRLAGMLRKLGYVYPYHQAIGFYLDAAGTYDDKSIALFHDRFDYEFDFYLTYGMTDTEYVRRWRIYVPTGFNPTR